MAGVGEGLSARLLTPADLPALLAAPPGLFDDPVRPDSATAFLADPRHHLAAVFDHGLIAGFASGVDYLHPDKPRELWINEVGVRDEYQRRGLGKAVVTCLLGHGRTLGCPVAWVLTETGNAAARRLYAACGGTETPAARHRQGVIMVSFDLGS